MLSTPVGSPLVVTLDSPTPVGSRLRTPVRTPLRTPVATPLRTPVGTSIKEEIIDPYDMLEVEINEDGVNNVGVYLVKINNVSFKFK